jgi:hypothetical protein
MPTKIVYLIGAGATHAELLNLVDDPDQKFKEEKGLLIADVSKRVMKRAHKTNPWFRKYEDVYTSTKGSFNIELLISLFEANRIPDYVISSLKKLVKDDIKKILSKSRREKFYLQKALFELHKKIADKEELLGVISLNYDSTLDEAYKKISLGKPNYCFTSDKGEGLPLLKLHGSFDWDKEIIYGQRDNIPIIPMGMNKNYLFPPYNFIWGKAYELLVKCDVLRIIGCSLNQNDLGLVDLLFKAHAKRRQRIRIKIVDFQPLGGHHPIKNSYGFFPDIIDPNPGQPDVNDTEETFIADTQISDYDKGNPFKIWLKAKALRMLTSDEIDHTSFLKKCF